MDLSGLMKKKEGIWDKNIREEKDKWQRSRKVACDSKRNDQINEGFK